MTPAPMPDDEATRGPDDSDPGPSSITPGPTNRPRVGEVLFGRYRVERCLGEGGMGSVWLVRHELFQAPRALKLIAPDLAADPDIRGRFRREARVMARLVHRNAVAIHEARLGEDAAYIEMEYVEGESLSSILRRGPLGLRRAGDLFEQLCDVLEAAHALGVVHRDLKPSNLMISADRSGGDLLKVLDFGIAKLLKQEGDTDDVRTQANLFLGTPHYSSPEQIQGGSVDPRSDLYSAAILLYEMLSGRRPFRSTGTSLIRDQITAPPPPFASLDPPAKISPAVERVVMLGLEKDPAKRFQTAREFLDAFRDARDDPATPGAVASTAWDTPDDPPTPRPPGPSRPAPVLADDWPRSGGRARGQLALGLGLPAMALIALGLAAYFGARRGGAAPRPARASRPAAKKAGPVSPFELGPEARRLLSTWRRQGYEPVTEEGTERGWPRTLSRSRGPGISPIAFRLGPTGHYLPAGHRPEGTETAPDGWPREVVREADGTRFLRIAGGRFRMGRLAADPSHPEARDRPAHDVILSGFYLQETEATRGEIAANAPGPSTTGRRGDGAYPDHPATAITHAEAEAYASGASALLPTEAQWEYAARSRSSDGVPFVWSWNPDLADRDPLRGGLAQVNREGTGDPPTCPVGRHRDTDVTEQGVVGLAGNVREWCRDVYAPYESVEPPPRDPCPGERTGPGDRFVVRGGAYASVDAESLRTTWRDRAPGGDAQSDIGFRVVLETPESPGPSGASRP